jgi:NAD(P)-dependent dehydrogenase (short-subunit alcohol dehydrogenase family)
VARKILVTAGASGIGKEIAKAFLAAGDTVYTCDINPPALDTAAHELKVLKTGVCDVGDRKQIEVMVADAAKQLGGIDVLVNNAGVSGPTAPVQDVDPDQWERPQGRPYRTVSRHARRHSSSHRVRQWRDH